MENENKENINPSEEVSEKVQSNEEQTVEQPSSDQELTATTESAAETAEAAESTESIETQPKEEQTTEPALEEQVQSDPAPAENTELVETPEITETQSEEESIPEVEASQLEISAPSPAETTEVEPNLEAEPNPEETNDVALETASEEVIDGKNTSGQLSAEELKTLDETIAPQTNVIDPVQTIDPTQVITPNSSVINTEKEKSPSNMIIFIFIIILGIFIFFVDDIINLFTEDNYTYYKGDSTDITSNNLVNGYIEIGSDNSFIKIDDIRFYNFKLGSSGIISFDYISNSSIKNSKELEIYIQIYDGNENIIYKELFNETEKIDKDTVKQYQMEVDNDVYLSAHFAKVLIFTNKEKLESSKVICVYDAKEEETTVNYEVVYNFTNNDLKNYKVTKTIETTNEEAESYKNYSAELADEKEEISKYQVNISEDKNFLSYTVDLTKTENKDIALYYKLNEIPYKIKYKETLKGWTCK